MLATHASDSRQRLQAAGRCGADQFVIVELVDVADEVEVREEVDLNEVAIKVDDEPDEDEQERQNDQGRSEGGLLAGQTAGKSDLLQFEKGKRVSETPKFSIVP